MNDLTDAQRKLLSRAAGEKEGSIDAPEDAKIAKALIKKGLAISLPVAGGASQLIITEADGRPSRTRSGLDASAGPQTADDRPRDSVRRAAPEGRPARARQAALRVGEQASPARGQRPATHSPRRRPPASRRAQRQARDAGGAADTPRGCDGRGDEPGDRLAGPLSARRDVGLLEEGLRVRDLSEKTDAGRIYKITTGEKA